MDQIKALLTRLPQSQDLGLAILLVMTITLMIIPMPTLVVDIFIGINFGIAALILMTAVYLRRPLDLSTLPGIILISTIFRLSLSVTTTRLILGQGDAGTIVRTFGEFVIAGNVVVGLVVFLIITIVQFMVVSKGAERVAEVGARFTLDAMPGKQMAIDAELRNGDITQEEARALRDQLGRENQLFGAMDGAMKFVKGDSIAGLIITAINLIGGITIGTVQRGLPAGEAMREYSLLTVGDALIAQIPALLMSITAATIVTRVTAADSQNLGRDISAQLFADPRALYLAAGLLIGMGLLPGFPTVILFSIAGLFGAIAFFKAKADKAFAESEGQSHAASPPAGEGADEGQGQGEGSEADPEEADTPGLAGDALDPLAPGAPVAFRLPPACYAAIGPELLQTLIADAQTRVASRLGIDGPEVGAKPDATLDDDVFFLDIDEVPAVTGRARPRTLHVDTAARPVLDERGLEYEPDGLDGAFLAMELRETLEEAGLVPLSSTEVLNSALHDLLLHRASSFIGIQETKAFFEAHEARYQDVMREVIANLSLAQIADLLRRLLDEEVSLRNLRIVLEALAEACVQYKDVGILAECVRIGLKRQLCYQHSSPEKVLLAATLAPATERLMSGRLQDNGTGAQLDLPVAMRDLFVRNAQLLMRQRREGVPVILIVPLDLRRHLAAILKEQKLRLPTLSYQELSDEFTVRTLVALDLVPQEARPNLDSEGDAGHDEGVQPSAMAG